MTPAEEPRARNNPDPAEAIRRSICLIGRASDRVIAFDRLEALLAVLDTTTAEANLLTESLCAVEDGWLEDAHRIGKTLPRSVVVGRNGAYWRDFGDHFSMCPISDDNDPVEPVARFALLAPADDAAAA